jgi:tetratricopeptide (TPR) repeat protein
VIRHLQARVNARARVAVLNALDDLLSDDAMSRNERFAGEGRLPATISQDVAQARYLTAGDLQTELEAIVSGWVAVQDHAEGAYAAALARAASALGVLESPVDQDTTPWQVYTLRGLVANCMMKLGDVAGARQIYQEELDRGLFAAEGRDALSLQSALASTYSADGDHRRAADLLRTVADTAAQAVGPDDDLTLSARNSLSMELHDLQELDESRQIAEQVLEGRIRVLGWTHRHTMNSRTNLASILSDLGEHDQARTLFQEVLDDRRRYLGDDHPDTVQSINNLAGVTEDPDQAARLYQEAVAAYTRMFGPTHFETLNSTSNLAAVLARQLRLDEAAVLFNEVVQGSRTTLGAEHPRTAQAEAALALAEHQRAVIHRGRDDPALAQLVAEWLMVPLGADTFRFFLEHPELADGRAEDLLSGLLADNPEDDWLADRAELLSQVTQAGLDTLMDLAHPQRWRAVYDREVDKADASALEQMIGWRLLLTGKKGPDDIGHLYVLLVLQNRTADARNLARAIAALGPEAVAYAMEVLDRLSRTKPDLALAGQVLLMAADGGGGILIFPGSPETPEGT